MYTHFKNPLVVQKYGGTSVGTPERIRSVAERIVAQYHAGYQRLAIVVSAMAGETNRLVSLVNDVHPNANPRVVDMAISAGEQVAVALLAAAVEARGVTTCPLLGFQLGIITDHFHSKARVQEINTQKIHEAWTKGQIPIIAGFQGVTKDMDITTLGRGGSDTSAVAVAVALKADFCEINTDVDGVYSADPRFVPNAKLIELMDYDVALEMAALGSKVLHSRCVELGAKYKIPIVVRNSFKENESKRTIIMSLDTNQSIESPLVSGVSVDKNVAAVSIDGMQTGADWISQIFARIADAGVNVDIIVHNHSVIGNRRRLAFTVTEAELAKTLSVIENIRGEFGFGDLKVESENNLAKVSVVGLGMQSHHGVASRAFSSLTTKGIDIRMITTSEIKISCVIPKAHSDSAANYIHKEFFE